MAVEAVVHAQEYARFGWRLLRVGRPQQRLPRGAELGGVGPAECVRRKFCSRFRGGPRIDPGRGVEHAAGRLDPAAGCREVGEGEVPRDAGPRRPRGRSQRRCDPSRGRRVLQEGSEVPHGQIGGHIGPRLQPREDASLLGGVPQRERAESLQLENLGAGGAGLARARIGPELDSATHQGVDLGSVALARSDPGEVHDRGEERRLQRGDSSPGRLRLRDGVARQGPVVELHFSQLEPRLYVVGIRRQHVLVEPCRLRCSAPPSGHQGLEQQPVVLRQPACQAHGVFRRRARDVRAGEPFRGDAHAVPGERELRILRDGSLKPLDCRVEIAGPKRAFPVQVCLERRQGLSGHRGDAGQAVFPTAPAGDELGRERIDQFEHPVRGTLDRGRAGRPASARVVQGGGEAEPPAHAEHIPQDEHPGTEMLGDRAPLIRTQFGEALPGGVAEHRAGVDAVKIAGPIQLGAEQPDQAFPRPRCLRRER